MAEFTVTRLLASPLGAVAEDGQRADLVRVSNGWATIYLDPAEYERSSEGGLLRKLAEVDPRPASAIGATTQAGGRTAPIHDAKPFSEPGSASAR
jgi:hypothetical protein